MAYDKAIDSGKLDAALTATADAIRSKTRTSDPIEWDETTGFSEEIAQISAGVDKEAYLTSIMNKTITELICADAVSICDSFQAKNALLTTVDLPNVTSLASMTFDNCDSLTDVRLPNVTTMNAGNFSNCHALEELYLPKLETITGWGWGITGCTHLRRAYFPRLTNFTVSDFANDFRLVTLILGADTVCTLPDTSVFAATPIAGRTSSTDGEPGYVYVPAALVDSYRTAANWSTYAGQIRAIEDYPEVLEGWE